MSISNLISTDINSANIPCTVSGAITGTGTLNFKRLDNIVYLSFLIPSQTVGVAGPTITITPNLTVPTQYQPRGGVFRELSVANNGVAAVGTIIFPGNFSSFVVSLLAGGNFTGTSGIIDSLIMWSVPDD